MGLPLIFILLILLTMPPLLVFLKFSLGIIREKLRELKGKSYLKDCQEIWDKVPETKED